MMDQFMIQGTQGPMAQMLSLRGYGRSIALDATVAGHVQWNKDQLLYKHLQFTMTQPRAMVHTLIKDATDTLRYQVLLDLAVPAISWRTLRDKPTN